MQVAKLIKRSQVLVAAAAMSLSLGASVSKATGLPYSTSFETAPDSNGDTYSTTANGGNLVGQNNWTYEDGESATGATVVNSGAHTGSQAINLSTPGTTSQYIDFYNANLADHVGSTAGTPGSALNTGSGLVNITFSMNTALGSTGDGAGVDIFDANDDIIASLFDVKESNSNNYDLEVLNTSNVAAPAVTVTGVNGDAPGRPDGTYGTYHINLNFNARTFTVFVDGNNADSASTYELPADATGGIGGIAFAMYDAGNGTAGSATFDDLTVVPEPASIGLITLGGLIMLAKRPKHRIA